MEDPNDRIRYQQMNSNPRWLSIQDIDLLTFIFHLWNGQMLTLSVCNGGE